MSYSDVSKAMSCRLSRVAQASVSLVAFASYKNIRAFWDIAPGSLLEVDRRFRGAYYRHHHGDE
jgi:hypothetical protein